MKRSAFALLACTAVLAGLAGGPAPVASADVATFYFAQHGMSYIAFLAEDSPLIGQEIVLTRIYLSVESLEGSDAGEFITDIGFPIEPENGRRLTLVLTGDGMGWSGSGVFHHFDETEEYNGVFTSLGYAAETFGSKFKGRVLEGSRIEFVTVPGPASAGVAVMAGAASLRRRRI